MNELNIYYHVVPIGDGYTFLCQDKNTGELYLDKKSVNKNPEALIFSSGQAAEEWIVMRLLEGKFKAEKFGTADVIEKFADVGCEI